MTAPRPVVPLLPVAGVMRCVIHQLLAGQQINNVFHVKQAGGGAWSQADADSFTAGLLSAWNIDVNAKLSNQLTLTGVTGVDLTNPTGVVSNQAASMPGGIASASLPASAAMTVHWPISSHYRGGHPRTYLGGLPSSAQGDANSWNNASVGNYITQMVNFRTTVNALPNTAGAIALVCVHRRRAKANLPVPTTEPLGVPTIDTGIDSQRRRLGKR